MKTVVEWRSILFLERFTLGLLIKKTRNDTVLLDYLLLSH